METAVMCDGTRSGVPWIRRNDRANERATAGASVVFPSPGTSSRSTCPSSRSAAKSCSVAARFPTTTCPTCSTRRYAASLTVVTPASGRFERGDAALRVRSPAADRAGAREGERKCDERRELVEDERDRVHDTQCERTECSLDDEEQGRRQEKAQRERSAVHGARGDGQHDDREEIYEPTRCVTGQPPVAAARHKARHHTVRDEDHGKQDRDDPEQPGRLLRQPGGRLTRAGLVLIAVRHGHRR